MRTELFVSRTGDEFCSARREDGTIVEFRVEGASSPPRFGRIVKARVCGVVPALQAAFLDVGQPRNAFLHVSDLLLPGESPGFDAPIQERLKDGRELLVQISRESVSHKGDRVTCHLGIPGRLLVLLPEQPQIAVSRRIEDSGERERLQAILEGLGQGQAGFVARTAANGSERSLLEAEAARLFETWRAIQDRVGGARPPAVVHEEPALHLRLLRDVPADGFDRMVLDDREAHAQALALAGQVDPALSSSIELHVGSRPLFETYGLEQEFEGALRPRVWLDSGGTIVIEPTEALVSIDVNSSKSVRGASPENTALETNLEAAREIARQIRLRDLGGIVAIDFIDLALEEHRQQLLDAMEHALRADPARTQIVGLSEIGLLQLTRERTRSNPALALTRPCPSCAGQGRVARTGLSGSSDE
jgi:ribonuclease G